jgi:uncharacterized delta-60 repeat protein
MTGKVTTPVGGSQDFAYSVAVQPDGKIVVAGSSSNGANDDIALVRYNTDGTLDTTFNITGKVTTPIGSGFDEGLSLVIQSNGKIIVAGYTFNGTNDDFALVRYNTDGSLDTTFNGTGIVTTPIGSGDDLGIAVALQADGKIVVGGFSNNGMRNDFALARYKADGSLDTTFNTTGKVITSIGVLDDQTRSVAVQPDGKIVAAGYSHNGTDFDFAVARYKADGSLDQTFNGTGFVTTPVGTENDYAYSTVLQTDGKIVAAGRSYNGTDNDVALARYNADGSLDTTFNTTGLVTTPIGAINDIAGSVVLQTNGKIVAAGSSDNGADGDFAVIRYNADGSLDTTFNATGIVTTPIGAGDDAAYFVALQPDGKIVAVGYSQNGTDYDFALARYWP